MIRLDAELETMVEILTEGIALKRAIEGREIDESVIESRFAAIRRKGALTGCHEIDETTLKNMHSAAQKLLEQRAQGCDIDKLRTQDNQHQTLLSTFAWATIITRAYPEITNDAERARHARQRRPIYITAPELRLLTNPLRAQLPIPVLVAELARLIRHRRVSEHAKSRNMAVFWHADQLRVYYKTSEEVILESYRNQYAIRPPQMSQAIAAQCVGKLVETVIGGPHFAGTGIKIIGEQNGRLMTDAYEDEHLIEVAPSS